MLLHCGLELFPNTIFAVLVNDQAKLLVKKVMPNNVEILIAFLEPYRLQLGEITMEETENWRMLVGPLAELGYRTVIV